MNRADLSQSTSSMNATAPTIRDAWLPTVAQIENAVKLRFDMAPDPSDPDPVIPDDSVLYASMRQAMGMIVAAATVAGLLPFLWNWITASRLGTVAPLADLQEAAGMALGNLWFGSDSAMTEMLETIAGLQPAVFPGWLAAGLSSLGVWINTPLHWLAWWIVYGLAVLIVAHLLGATTTLQQFYTVTSFGCLPLILTGLGPIPCLGAIAILVAFVWALVVYVTAVRSVTRLSFGMSLLSALLPGATLVLLSIVVAVATAATVVSVLR